MSPAREEFVVVGWTDPEGSRPWLGALLLAYYDPDGRLTYAGRAGTGIDYAELERLLRRLQPLAIPQMPLDLPPPRDSRFGSPLTLSRVHWVRPELVAEVKYLTWTDDNLLRQVVYEGLREAGGGGPPRGALPETRRTGAFRHPLKTAAVRLRALASARRTYFLVGSIISRPGKPDAVRPSSNLASEPSPARAASGGPTSGAAMLFFSLSPD